MNSLTKKMAISIFIVLHSVFLLAMDNDFKAKNTAKSEAKRLRSIASSKSVNAKKTKEPLASRLKKGFVAIKNKFTSFMKHVLEDDDMPSFIVCIFDDELRESKFVELLNNHDQEKLDDKTFIKRVAQQDDAECGYHALVNALNCFHQELSPDEAIPYLKEKIAKNRNRIRDNQWLCEDELSTLIKEYKGMNSITLIGDISMYYDGTAGLERSALEELASAQEAIQLGENYRHVFILGTMDGRNNQRFAHWIAVELLIRGGKIVYWVMDSLQSSHKAKQIKRLQAILEVKENRLAINLLENEDLEEKVSNYLSQLSLAHIFEEQNRCYALKGDRTDDCSIIVNKKPEIIIDSILKAAAHLILEVEEMSFWSTEGYIQPDVKILNALKNIKDCDQQYFVCKENSCDSIPDILPTLQLTLKQREHIEMIERAIADLH